MTAILTIGTATKRIDLLDGAGWHLSRWRPVATGHLSTMGQSALADGEELESYREANATEVLTLELGQPTQDMADRATQQLRRMLRRVIDYWATEWQNSPVYLERRGACETNSAYALVYDARLPEDGEPFAEPFAGRIPGPDAAGMDEMRLEVTHGPWLEKPPGEQACVEAAAYGTALTTYTMITARPLASTDDVTYVESSGAFLTGSTTLFFGNDGTGSGSYETGVRFQGVNVPAGANVFLALVAFVADSTRADQTNIRIWGEDQDDAAAYSDIPDFFSRPRTDAKILWHADNWVLGQTYYAWVTNIIQEIVARPGWVAGNDIALRFGDWFSALGASQRAAAWDNLVRTEPILTIYYTVEGNYGMDTATCGEGVLLANKQNTANITHIYRDNAGVWEGNLIGAALPWGIFPVAPVQNNDAVYFGIDSTAPDSGPFCSLAFTIGTPATWAGPTAHVHWEYWNGAWVALAIVDNTSSSVIQPFARDGTHSIHFSPPADWTPVDIGPGPTCWYIRCVVQLGAGDSVTVPTEVTRYPFTVTWGSCLIGADQVPGDIPALLRAIIHCPSGTNDWAAGLGADRVILGMRSVERGEDFSAYINWSGQQNPTGIIITLDSAGNFVLAADPRAVTGTWMVLTPPLAGPTTWQTDGPDIQFNSAMAGQYAGTYHAFLRAQLVPGAGGVAGDIGFRLSQNAWGFNPTQTIYSQEAYNKHTGMNELFDLGEIKIPAFPWRPGVAMVAWILNLEWRAMDDDFTVIVHDLILIPVDEWAADIQSWEELTNAPYALMYTLGRAALDIDGALDPKHVSASVCLTYPYLTYAEWVAANYERSFAWRMASNGPPTLRANRAQRLWVTSTRFHWDGTMLYRASNLYVVHQAQLFRNARYQSARGDR